MPAVQRGAAAARARGAAAADHARSRGRVLHIHACEQPAELAECRAEHGAEPVAVLERLGVEAESLLAEVPGLSGVTTPRTSGPDQLRVNIDRDLAHEMGVDSDSIQQTISYVLHGFPLPRYQEGGRDVPLQIEFDELQKKVQGLSSVAEVHLHFKNLN